MAINHNKLKSEWVETKWGMRIKINYLFELHESKFESIVFPLMWLIYFVIRMNICKLPKWDRKGTLNFH